jgi:methionine-rich copper-binding protein CopC
MHRRRGSRATASAGLALFAALFIAALGTMTAQARPFHAAYKSSNPAANSVLKTVPTVVSITFVQKLDPQGLNITVYGNKAEVVSTGKAQIAATDPYTATVTMKGDGSDIYRVDWNNVSAEDGDSTLGAFVFAVDPSGQSDKVTPASTTTVTTTTGVSTVAAILIGIAGLVVGGAGTYVFGVRSRRN